MADQAFSYTNKKGQTYFLHTREVTLKNGRKQRIYYFARDVRANDAIKDIPGGYKVVETEKTGLPLLKKA
ncbi:hypothetical protein FWH30_01290 [Microgenomates group bacterium]|nr:hypothetical protein [Microgenomates group bacterium]